jgi:signal transduction histidine kinase
MIHDKGKSTQHLTRMGSRAMALTSEYPSHSFVYPHSHWNVPGHLVQYYESDNFLIKALYEFVSSGLLGGERCVVIAAPRHIEYLEEAMLANGINPTVESHNGRYAAVNAEVLLNQIMPDTLFSEELAMRHIGDLLAQADNQRQRVFGEIATLLWHRGSSDAVLKLEACWNRLMNTHHFSLCCAYPLRSFNKAHDAEFLGRISRCHAHIVPGESYNRAASEEESMRAVVLLQQKAGAARSATRGRETAERALRQSELEREHLAELNIAKDEFISLASHQLRTPATVVKLYLGMLLDGYDGRLPADMKKSLQKAFESNERQIKIVNELLLVARVDAGKVRLAKESFNIARLIRSVAADQQPTIVKRGQKLTLRLPRRFNIAADKQYLRMVLENLLDNASKYSPEDKPITIRLEPSDKRIAIHVIDQGIGIAPEEVHKLYQKFSRLPSPISDGVEGTGLGLYWSKKIIELHSGELTLMSRVNYGSTFTISLPV